MKHTEDGEKRENEAKSKGDRCGGGVTVRWRWAGPGPYHDLREAKHHHIRGARAGHLVEELYAQC